VLPVQNMQ